MIKTFKEFVQPLSVVVIILVAKFFIPSAFLIEVMLFSIFIMSCNFLLGYGGLLSFGQPLYLGVGAYTTACYLFYFGQNPFIGLLVGIIAGAIFALGIGVIIIKLRSSYFVLANAALNVIGVFLVYDLFSNITGGMDGMWFLTRMNPVLGIDLTNTNHFFIFSAIVMLFILLLTQHIMKSMFGTICLAANTNEDKVRFLGYSVFKTKLLSFIYSCMLASLSGSLYAIYFGFVCPSMMEQEKAGEVVATTILGGVGTLFGPIVGAVIIVAAKDLTSNIIQHWEVLVGGLLVIIVLKADKGVVGLFNDYIEKRKVILKKVVQNK